MSKSKVFKSINNHSLPKAIAKNAKAVKQSHVR
jgi:hypothetical protein